MIVSNAWTATPNYRSSYTYDGNGNLKSLVRVDSAGTLMDSLVYRYQTNRNRLTHVDDPGGVAGNHSFDVDDQDTNTYTYDASGNMIGDTASGITAIVWTPSNKIQSITKGTNSKLEYTYDAMGNRVVKRFYQPTSTLKSTTWYARDAQGNILSVYERPHADSAIKQSEVHIYGSSRLGIEQRGITYSTSNYAWIGSEQHRNAGSKRYELTDHLGNVRVTISDLLIARPTGFGDTTQDAEVIDRRDYYPFGMEMPGRRWRASGEDAARFGFNGKENDNEVKGEGNQQDYGFRIYDPRIARFLSVDPLEAQYPWYTPYQFAGNDVIRAIDRDGLEPAYTVPGSPFIHGASDHLQHTPPAQAQFLQEARSIASNDPRDLSPLDFMPIIGNFKSGFGAIMDFEDGNTTGGLLGAVGAVPGLNYIRSGLKLGAKGLSVVSKILRNSNSVDIATSSLKQVFVNAGVDLSQVVVKQGSDRVVLIGETMGRIDEINRMADKAFDTFEGTEAANREFMNLLESYAQKGMSSVPDDVVKSTMLFKENQAWIKQAMDEGATIVDVGIDESRASRSTFYRMERGSVYGGSGQSSPSQPKSNAGPQSGDTKNAGSKQ